MKKSLSYYLDEESHEWIVKQADKAERSASWYLNKLIKELSKGKKK